MIDIATCLIGKKACWGKLAGVVVAVGFDHGDNFRSPCFMIMLRDDIGKLTMVTHEQIMMLEE